MQHDYQAFNIKSFDITSKYIYFSLLIRDEGS